MCECLDALKDTGGPLAHANTHGHHAVFALGALQRVDDRGGTNRPGGPQRVTQRNGPRPWG